MRQHKIPAVYMRGGTSKGIFFKAEDLPADSYKRDLILLRALGSPDPYGNQLDGLGDANSTTNRVVLVSTSYRDDCDVDFICGQVGIDTPTIDWSGNFANLAAAVGPFAISEDLCDAPAEGMATVRMWQAGIGKKSSRTCLCTVAKWWRKAILLMTALPFLRHKFAWNSSILQRRISPRQRIFRM